MTRIAHIIDVLDTLQERGEPFYEFLRESSLSAGVYHLSPDMTDRQTPHREDEIYYVLAGEGRITIDGETTDLRPGHVVFVPAHAEHHFSNHDEGLTLLVIFAPPYTGPIRPSI